MKKMMILVLLLVGISISKDLAVQGTGYGMNEAEALTRAKQDALSKGIGQSLISSTEVENYMIKKDVVLSETLGNIKSVKIIESTKGEDGAYKVSIHAVVSEIQIREDLARLKILQNTISNPRIALLIQESFENEKSENGIVEIELINFLKSRAFEVVDPNQILKFSESKEGALALGGDPEALERLAKRVNAEIIIVGSLESKETDVSQNSYFKDTGMKSASSMLRLKAIDVGTRRLMASAKSEASMVHPNSKMAAEKASSKALKKMLESEDGFFDRLIAAWQKEANDGKIFQITISGVNSFSEASLLKEKFKEGYTSLKQLGFHDNILELEFGFLGDAEALALRIESLGFDKKILKVKGMKNNSFEIEFIPVLQE